MANKKPVVKKTTQKAKTQPEISPNATVTFEAKAQPEAAEWEIKDRVYHLVGDKTPILFTIPGRHTAKRPLLWFDEERKYEREIRYATNKQSVFADEQEGHVTLEHIAFRDGTLVVPKNKQSLQKLLSIYHPLKDVLYTELDETKEAIQDIDYMDMEFDAMSAAREMDIDMAEAILRVEIGSKVSHMSSKELKRDVRLFARQNPRLFLELANDDNVQLRNLGVKSVEAGIMKLAADQRTFMWSSTGRKVMTVPYGENPYSALAAFFKTDEGVEVYQSIEKRLS